MRLWYSYTKYFTTWRKQNKFTGMQSVTCTFAKTRTCITTYNNGYYDKI